jgi:hypothetical protein
MKLAATMQVSASWVLAAARVSALALSRVAAAVAIRRGRAAASRSLRAVWKSARAVHVAERSSVSDAGRAAACP